MNLLLDTQALLWWREGSRKLGPRARAAIETEDLTIVTSDTAFGDYDARVLDART
jgi:PIN domain nuclease of toxin-antitoxin system